MLASSFLGCQIRQTPILQTCLPCTFANASLEGQAFAPPGHSRPCFTGEMRRGPPTAKPPRPAFFAPGGGSFTTGSKVNRPDSRLVPRATKLSFGCTRLAARPLVSLLQTVSAPHCSFLGMAVRALRALWARPCPRWRPGVRLYWDQHHSVTLQLMPRRSCKQLSHFDGRALLFSACSRSARVKSFGLSASALWWPL